MEAEDILPDLPVEETEVETEAKSETILTIVESTPDLPVEEMQFGDAHVVDDMHVDEPQVEAQVEAQVEEQVEVVAIGEEQVSPVVEEQVVEEKVIPVATAPVAPQASSIDMRKEVETLLYTLEQSHDRRINQLTNSQKEMGSLLHSLNDSMKKLEHFEKLDQLKAIEKLTDQLPDRKTLIIRYVLTFGLETVKLFLAGFVVVFLLSRETGREIAVKTLPALGFGSAGQVNLGLKLMVGETSPEDFQAIVADVKKRIDAEMDVAFSASGFLTLNRRLEMIAQVKSYSFQGAGVDLSKEVEKKLQERLEKLHENAVARIGFEQALAKGKQKAADEDKLREIKLLLIQKQYPLLLEKVLPQWGTNEALTLAAIVGSAQLLINDPSTLDQIINTHMPGKGKL